MGFDFEPYFQRYEAIVKVCDEVFKRVKDENAACVTCSSGCSDCCHALFDLTFIEALYINHQFKKTISDEVRLILTEKANKADRKTYKIKKHAYKDFKNGISQNEILRVMAEERVRCPLLNDENLCDMYEYRPITCRLYGIPVSIGGEGHTCGLSNFKQGKNYPTVNQDSIQNKLYDISKDLVIALKSRHIRMSEMLVPLSMSLLTDYNDDFLGISRTKPDSKEPGEKKHEK